MIDDDMMLANAEAKIHYNFWRPVTAIRNADQDGNPATEADVSWEPQITTPNHPEYPCAHCAQSAATAELMKSEYGNTPASGVRISSLSIPNAVVQVHPSWDKWAEEVSASRIFGGVHYRFSNEAGAKMGREIAREFLQDAATPEAIAPEMLRLLEQREVRIAQQRAQAEVIASLGQRGAATRAADAILRDLDSVRR